MSQLGSTSPKTAEFYNGRPIVYGYSLWSNCVKYKVYPDLLYLAGRLMNQVTYTMSIPTSQTGLLFTCLDKYSNNF